MIRLIPALAGKTSFLVLAADDDVGSSPRWRGKLAHLCLLLTSTGSSPRWRGKRRELPARPGSSRLIPALAGKTQADGLILDRHTAHPRAGGENDLTRDEITLRGGSSPRWRGKLGPCSRRPSRFRLIPALAGKTTAPRRTSWTCRAHPRAGGENMPCLAS